MRNSPTAVPSQNGLVSGVGTGTGPCDTFAPFCWWMRPDVRSGRVRGSEVSAGRAGGCVLRGPRCGEPLELVDVREDAFALGGVGDAVVVGLRRQVFDRRDHGRGAEHGPGAG